MGKKKNKEEPAPAAGNLSGDAAISSIFSDSNPFKRKPTEPPSEKPNQTPTDVDTPDDSTNRKRSKLKISSNDTSKSKSIEVLEDEDRKGDRNVGAVIEDKIERKKRKRDDVEGEYEAKKYGAVLEDKDNVAVVVVGEKRKKTENEADMLVSKDPEGFDDESKLLRTVFVGNLPLKVKKKALIKEFSQFGEVESVRIRSVPIADTKIPRKGAIMLKKFNDGADSVHAYIVFNTEESAVASLSYNMAMVAGNHIRVDRACPPRKKLKGEGSTPLYDNKRTVFVGNLPFDVKDEEIYKLFASMKDLESSIEAVRVIRDTHIGLGKGIAYVLFKTKEAANLVLRKRNLKIRNRELRISHAKQDSNSTPSKRSRPFPADAAGSPNKRASIDSRTPDRKGGFNTPASTSYQGLRASKSGVQKKAHPKQTRTVQSKYKSQSGDKRLGKRPSVAARKEKANAINDGSASAPKQAGQKRKFRKRTPESNKVNKKAKKFR
ncbi:RNA-binding (RRM/RBD/RNP motifs) family protein [Euphorbia peplus]|nr:RNA-binding (RRM/RBD/RNP motifs) family protein [Euphorbia peplus]